MELKIEYLKKEELKPYANNAKIHTAKQIEQIKNSIRRFGFNDPIAVWHDNEIIEGHGRLLAAMEMNEIEAVPVIRLDNLTDKQRKAYMLAHNKLTMNTDFDLDILGMEIDEIAGEIDLTDIGFNEAELLELQIDDSPEEISITPAPVPAQYKQEDANGEFKEDAEEAYEGYSPQQPNPFGAVSRTELEEYESRADAMVTRRVIIVFKTDEEEAFVRGILKVPDGEKLGVIYLAEKMMEQ